MISVIRIGLRKTDSPRGAIALVGLSDTPRVTAVAEFHRRVRNDVPGSAGTALG